MKELGKAMTLLALLLCLSASSPPCTLAAACDGKGKPLVTAVTKDPATLLYTSPLLEDSRRLLLDLSGPLIWAACDGGAQTQTRGVTLSANATDGKTPLYPVSFPAAASCAPRSLLAGLPAGAAGVAGLASAALALPAQAARAQKVAARFLLCLPRRGDGVAVFGGGPFFLPAPMDMGDLSSTLTHTALLAKKGSPAYYLPVEAIAVGTARLPLPAGTALAAAGVALDTRAPYGELRPDVYRPLVDAFNRTLGRDDARVPAVPPFELCYDSGRLGPTRIGYLVPDVVLMLQGGKNWTFTGPNSMVDVDNRTACLAFVEAKRGHGGGAAPAVVVGGFQMEDFVLQFDLEKRRLGFAKVRFFTACSNFNFTGRQ
ncbi:hypothetical protein ACP70R_001114 [Stipagrostis hirtigluma subsp. patula]